MNLSRKVAYNTIVQVVGKVVTTVISLFLVAALTRYLGVTGYGAYTTIFAFTQFFAVIADFGFFWFLVREISKPGADVPKISNNILTFRTFMALGVYILSVLIGFMVPQYHDLRIGIAIIAAASFWMTLNGTYVGIFQSNLRMDKAAITDVLGRIAIIGVVFYQISHGSSLNHILWAYFFGNFINFALSFILGRVYLKYRPAFDWAYWNVIFYECLPIAIVSILSLIYFKVDTVMLSLLKTQEDVGIYGPPYKVVEILVLFPAIFMGNVFPILTRYLHEKNEKFYPAFQKSFDFLVLSALPIVAGIVLLAPRIIQIVAGNDFVAANTVGQVFGINATSAFALQILIFAVGLSFLSHLFGYTIIAVGKQAKMLWPNAFLVVFNIGLNLILIPRISYIGAAMVTVMTEIVVLLLYSTLMRRYIEVKISLRIFWKALLAAILMSLALYFGRASSLWLLIPLAIVIYILVLLLIKGVSKNMIKEVIMGKES